MNNKFVVQDYNGNKVKFFGTAKIKCVKINSNVEQSEQLFLIVKNHCDPILS